MGSKEYRPNLKQITSDVKSIVEEKKPRTNIEQTWQEIEDIYQSSAQAIVAVGEQVNEVMNLPGVKNYIENASELNVAIKGLSADLEIYTQELICIHNQHANYSGVIKAKDASFSIDIFEQYVGFNTKFKSTTLPTFMFIMEQAGQSAQKAAAQKQQPIDGETA